MHGVAPDAMRQNQQTRLILAKQEVSKCQNLLIRNRERHRDITMGGGGGEKVERSFPRGTILLLDRPPIGVCARALSVSGNKSR